MSEPDTERVVTVDPAPQIDLVKSDDLNDLNANGLADAGETITYSFKVTNTGNVTLHDVHVTDEMVTGFGDQIINRLAPGDSAIILADAYTVTKGDVAEGSLVNHASATGTVSGGSQHTGR